MSDRVLALIAAQASYLRKPNLLEGDTLERCQLPRISSLRLVAHSNTRKVDILGQLLRHLRQDVCEGGRGLDSEAELAFFAHKPEYHAALCVGEVEYREGR